MKILYHHRTQGTGAEGVHIAHVIQELRRLGHDVDVLSPTAEDPARSAGENPYGGRGGLKRKVLHRFSRSAPQWLFELAELSYNASAYPKLRRRLNAGRDLVYERHAFFLVVGAYLARRTRSPFIIEVNEVAGEKRVRRLVLTELAQRIERYVFERASAIIVVSEFLKAKIAEQGILQDKIHVVPNGVDERVFHPGVDRVGLRQALGIDPQTVVIGFVGWFVAWHNLELLVQALANVAEGRQVKLMLVGDGLLKADLCRQAESAGVLERLVFPGAVPHTEIPKYLNSMDICVIPGSNAYRSPIKLFEYMVMGKAVVAPAHPPITQIMQAESEGLVFQPDDCGSLTECLRRLIDDRPLRERLGAGARAKILQSYLWRHNAERVLAIYEQLKS